MGLYCTLHSIIITEIFVDFHEKILLVFLGMAIHRTQGVHFFSPSPYWCFIDKKYVVERVVGTLSCPDTIEMILTTTSGDYVYLWLACLLLLIVYSLLFLRLRGWVIVSPDRWSRIRFVKRASTFRLSQSDLDGRSRQNSGETEIGTSIGRREAYKMLLYPVCYIV